MDSKICELYFNKVKVEKKVGKENLLELESKLQKTRYVTVILWVLKESGRS